MTLTFSMVPGLHPGRIQEERDVFGMTTARESVFADQLDGIRTFSVRNGHVFGAPLSQWVGASNTSHGGNQHEVVPGSGVDGGELGSDIGAGALGYTQVSIDAILGLTGGSEGSMEMTGSDFEEYETASA